MEALLPEEQVDKERRKRTSPIIKVKEFTRLSSESQTFVTLTTKREGRITVGPQQQLYEKQGCWTASGVVNVQPSQQFRVLIANFNLHSVNLNPRQVVAMSSAHPEKIVESYVTLTELLGLIPDIVETKYRKRHVNVRDIDTINQHLTNERERHMGDDEKPVTAE